MPFPYILLHLILSALAARVAFRLPGRSRAARLIGALTLGVVALGLLMERRPEWGWPLLNLRWPDAVFMTNLSLEGVMILLAVMWRKAENRWARVRAVVLSLAALAVALWSYAWLFAPLPPGLRGTVSPAGLCLQTTEDSCSAAAAAMLLFHYHILTSETEMAKLCVTRAGFGTSQLGLFRGLSLKAAEHGLHPRLVFLKRVGDLHQWAPCILSIGLQPGTPSAIAVRMSRYGWEAGAHHSILIRDADPAGRWLDVTDPGIGFERWPSKDIQYIWDGKALVLVRS